MSVNLRKMKERFFKENVVNKFVPTTMEWYPTLIRDGKPVVRVRICYLTPFPETEHLERWRVCAWGGDDYGVERDFFDFQEALECYLNIHRFDSIPDFWNRS